ncbi:lamin tail domain-containing protein [Streptomyces sp. NPDC050617]|uniref:lamin tail domain-containing protein n=1 Tax=Streptomyces sp. NPDC050617 TaxID=3154628 RepID=UPI00341C134F
MCASSFGCVRGWSRVRGCGRVASRGTARGVRLDAALLAPSGQPAPAPEHEARLLLALVDHSHRGLNAGWVEVKNLSRHPANLRGFPLTDQQGNRCRFDRLRLEGRFGVTVHTGRGHGARHDVCQGRCDCVWDNDHDTATLRDARGHVPDRAAWGRGRHRRWPHPQPQPGQPRPLRRGAAPRSRHGRSSC